MAVKDIKWSLSKPFIVLPEVEDHAGTDVQRKAKPNDASAKISSLGLSRDVFQIPKALSNMEKYVELMPNEAKSLSRGLVILSNQANSHNKVQQGRIQQLIRWRQCSKESMDSM
jgi:hypothetical protein